MSKPLTSRWDVAASLDDPDLIKAYLTEAKNSGDPELMAHALDDVLRSLGAFSLNQMVGLSRDGIFQALNRDGRPKVVDVLQEIIDAEGLMED